MERNVNSEFEGKSLTVVTSKETKQPEDCYFRHKTVQSVGDYHTPQENLYLRRDIQYLSS